MKRGILITGLETKFLHDLKTKCFKRGCKFMFFVNPGCFIKQGSREKNCYIEEKKK